MDPKLPPNHAALLNRFVQVCQSDERIAAALLVGSYATGMPDEYSDLDLYVIISDESYDDFVAKRESFFRLLGNPCFMEDFELPEIVFLIFLDGSEVELAYLPESQANQVLSEPFKVLLDKRKITEGVVEREHKADPNQQREKLRRLIYWFWHDFSHFVTAMGRNQLWWAHGQLDVLRSMCVGLARLKNDFWDLHVEDEIYFKIERVMPTKALFPLQETFCPMEKTAMLKAVLILVSYYKDLAVSLSQEHGMTYPADLERVMVSRLEKLAD